MFHIVCIQPGACSWQDGYRCFPGTCTGNMLHPSECKCSLGFGGNNCATGNRNLTSQRYCTAYEIV